jgi:hypothetical protein
MPNGKVFPAIGVAIIASVVACGLLLFSNSAPFSSPDKSIAAFVDAESRADLSAMEKPSSGALYQNFIGHFGESKYWQIRNIYQHVYDLAEPQWEQYRYKARAVAEKEHQNLAEQVDKLGRAAFNALPADQRLAITDDRPRFNQFIFEEGLKALPTSDRAKIADPQAFRANKDLDQFTDREGFNLLPDEDQKALKTPAALSATLTPERIVFLESIGLSQLSAEQRQTIAGIPSSELSNPQELMQRYGRAPASDFLKNSALDPKVSQSKCTYTAEDNFGSLFRGSIANCSFSINVRGERHEVTAEMQKQGGLWKIVSLFPMLTRIREAYPPKSIRNEPALDPTASSPTPAPEAAAPVDIPVQRVQIPYASWKEVTDPSSTAVKVDSLLVALAKLFPGRLEFVITGLLIFLAILLFCVVMTINFRQLRRETFTPEWLEGEIELEEVQASHWWSRVWIRLTNKRIVQVQLSWFFARRRVFSVALDDIHSVTWRRYTNWLLIVVGIWLLGKTNPIALLFLMCGLESKVLSIGFNAPLAQMPFPRAHARIISFRRRQFKELAVFYKKAQLHLAQVRSQKQLPVPRSMNFIPEEDLDFSWGPLVWLFVALWLLIALGQRTFGAHVTLEGIWGGLLLGLPVAAAGKSLRCGVWSGILGASALVAIKFPGSIGLVFMASGSEGGYPNLWQYVILVAASALIALAAYGLSRVHWMAAYPAPLIWLLPIAMMQPSALVEARTYATCFFAITSAALFSILAEVASGRANTHDAAHAETSLESAGA